MKTIKNEKQEKLNMQKMGFLSECFIKLGIEIGFLTDDKDERNCIPAYTIIAENKTVGIIGETTKNKRTAFYIAAAEAVQFLYGQGTINKAIVDRYTNLLKEFYNTNRNYA